MAQNDIRAIADYMKSINDSIAEEDLAYRKACREADSFYAEEDTSLEDEIIDKTSMGFIDDADEDFQDESDGFYDEDEVDPFNEDISDCVNDPFNEADEDYSLGSIEIEVFNEDGFGDHFVEELQKNVAGIDTEQVGTTPTGDLIVKISGAKSNLEDAYAFYLGSKSFKDLPDDDKNEFASLLVFDDGDTLAEADYREALAHCLDSIGVNASTANLKAQDTCEMSTIREERLKRKFDKSFKYLKENDLENVDDDSLEILGTMEDCADEGNTEAEDIEKELEQKHQIEAAKFEAMLKKLGFKSKAEWDARSEDDRTWLIILAGLGYTEAEWEAMTPEQQERIWKSHEDSIKADIERRN